MPRRTGRTINSTSYSMALLRYPDPRRFGAMPRIDRRIHANEALFRAGTRAATQGRRPCLRTKVPVSGRSRPGAAVSADAFALPGAQGNGA
jgi:hypothetical protein